MDRPNTPADCSPINVTFGPKEDEITALREEVKALTKQVLDLRLENACLKSQMPKKAEPRPCRYHVYYRAPMIAQDVLPHLCTVVALCIQKKILRPDADVTLSRLAEAVETTEPAQLWSCIRAEVHLTEGTFIRMKTVSRDYLFSKFTDRSHLTTQNPCKHQNLNKVQTPGHAATLPAQGIAPNLLLQILAGTEEPRSAPVKEL